MTASIAFMLLLGIFWGATPQRLKIDGISGELWDLVLSTDTKYSDGYSDSGFNQVKVGMSKQEVIEILGEPLAIWSPYKYSNYKDKDPV